MSQGKVLALQGAPSLHFCLAPAQLIELAGGADTNPRHHSNPTAVTQPQLGSLGRLGRAVAFADVSSTKPLVLSAES